MENNQELTEGPRIESWAPAFENYRLKEIDGGTEFKLEVDTIDEEYDYFMETWPKALDKLKEISEKGV